MKAGIRSNWSNAVLVCSKCSRKLDGGFGPRGRTPLAKALRKHLGLKKGRKGAAGIVEVKCLGVCPRGAVTVVNGAQAREWLLVPAGANLDAVAGDLGLND
ncbi:(2Fe-2S) ferredoxin domain-containing protein [Sphingomonas sp. DG1-23]|uniref:(2Fe-2S) ferredoxin domain-containing protein n=1 Tax=Sphingomonas sp. DG1-23 TaxID=3068316 RepID=UPI00273E7700|nr:(2Fe-2S) ferredoxin domain-containing protein [Sphingomonas sp. DG1-23]MDP5278008.1 (2Fe-2S) ferredoxin domain-containing protein [Sphingomonas sp. DG1-23]